MSSAKKTGRAAPAPSSAMSVPPIIEVKAGVFKDTCLELLDDVRERRVEIVVTKHGAPVAKLVALEAAPSARGFMRGTVIAHGNIVAPDFDAWGDSGE